MSLSKICLIRNLHLSRGSPCLDVILDVATGIGLVYALLDSRNIVEDIELNVLEGSILEFFSLIRIKNSCGN
jgi:hypothetical protein